MTTIIGIKMSNRVENSVHLQEILTKFGCAIKSRIGLHNVQNGVCSPHGLILLEIVDNQEALAVEKELLAIDNIEIQKMVFDID